METGTSVVLENEIKRRREKRERRRRRNFSQAQ